jgi:hypothetical protein
MYTGGARFQDVSQMKKYELIRVAYAKFRRTCFVIEDDMPSEAEHLAIVSTSSRIVMLVPKLTWSRVMIENSFRSRVKRLLLLGSGCIDPKLPPWPPRDEYLLTGPAELCHSCKHRIDREDWIE